MNEKEIARQQALLFHFLDDNVILKKAKTHTKRGLYIGIDPGLTGAIGFVIERKDRLLGMAIDIPMLQLNKPKKIKRIKKPKKRRKNKYDYDNRSIHDIFAKIALMHRNHYCDTMIFIEKGHTFGNVGRFNKSVQQGQEGTFQRESAVTAQRIGWATGMWPLYLQYGLGLPLELHSPSSWKKKMELTSDKEACRALAVNLFPTAELSYKKDHNRAEALLLAYYAYQSHKEQLEPQT